MTVPFPARDGSASSLKILPTSGKAHTILKLFSNSIPADDLKSMTTVVVVLSILRDIIDDILQQQLHWTGVEFTQLFEYHYEHACNTFL